MSPHLPVTPDQITAGAVQAEVRFDAAGNPIEFHSGMDVSSRI